MSDHVLVWDLETVPDLEAVARVNDLAPGDEQGAREILGDKFPKHPFHKIVCIGAVIAQRVPAGWKVISKGAPHIGQRSEAGLIEAFVNRIEELQPTLVTFNGNGFDLVNVLIKLAYSGITQPPTNIEIVLEIQHL